MSEGQFYLYDTKNNKVLDIFPFKIRILIQSTWLEKQLPHWDNGITLFTTENVPRP